MRVTLYKRGSPHMMRVHRLVLEAFIGSCPASHYGCHKNDNQADNRLSNLYWGTVRQNTDDRERNGKTLRGSKVTRASITDKLARDIKHELKITTGYGSLKRVAEKFNVSYGVVAGIKYGNAWNHVEVK